MGGISFSRIFSKWREKAVNHFEAAKPLRRVEMISLFLTQIRATNGQ